jgi:hypothetical protein
MGILDMLRSYELDDTGALIHEKHELDEATIATVSDIEKQMRYVEETRQRHQAWFDVCLEMARAIGFPRHRLPYGPNATVLSGEVPWRLFLKNTSVPLLKTFVAPGLKERLDELGLPDGQIQAAKEKDATHE